MHDELAPLPGADSASGTHGAPFQTERKRWPHVANAGLGAWLALSPATYGPQTIVFVANDLVCGVVIIALSAVACAARRQWPVWSIAAIGLWLMTAPLVFWAPAADYAVDTLIGTLLVVFAVLIPGSSDRRSDNPEMPPGWTYNPSAWTQRLGIVALAFAQFLIARHLAAYQLGHIDFVWDPVFRGGTQQVLESDVSRAFPVSDAGLGALTYLIEALTGLLGGTRRWRTMPWVVLLFGVQIIPVGIVSVVLVILQPLAVGAWCFLCLITAAVTVLMISPALDEVLATSQFLLYVRRQGGSVWNAFWRGGGWDTATGERPFPRHSLMRRIAEGLELTLIPWTLGLCSALGIWLMLSPVALGFSGARAASDQLTGALIFTFATIGFGESARSARWLNIPLGAWLIISAWFLPDAANIRWHEPVIGGLVLALTVPLGRVESRFGGWDHWIV